MAVQAVLCRSRLGCTVQCYWTYKGVEVTRPFGGKPCFVGKVFYFLFFLFFLIFFIFIVCMYLLYVRIFLCFRARMFLFPSNVCVYLCVCVYAFRFSLCGYVYIIYLSTFTCVCVCHYACKYFPMCACACLGESVFVKGGIRNLQNFSSASSAFRKCARTACSSASSHPRIWIYE